MLPIDETVKIDGVKYRIETTDDGYLITTDNNQFTLLDDDDGRWYTKDEIPSHIVQKLCSKIDDLIWFRSNGV